MRFLILAVLAVSIVGCGQSEKVTISDAGEKGLYQKQIDISKDTAAEASARIKEGDREAFGS